MRWITIEIEILVDSWGRGEWTLTYAMGSARVDVHLRHPYTYTSNSLAVAAVHEVDLGIRIMIKIRIQGGNAIGIGEAQERKTPTTRLLACYRRSLKR